MSIRKDDYVEIQNGSTARAAVRPGGGTLLYLDVYAGSSGTRDRPPGPQSWGRTEPHTQTDPGRDAGYFRLATASTADGAPADQQHGERDALCVGRRERRLQHQ